jgi:hypothetical protein
MIDILVAMAMIMVISLLAIIVFAGIIPHKPPPSTKPITSAKEPCIACDNAPAAIWANSVGYCGRCWGGKLIKDKLPIMYEGVWIYPNTLRWLIFEWTL